MQFLNREPHWGLGDKVPSGWGHTDPPGRLKKLVHKMYEKYQFLGAKKPGRHGDPKFYGGKTIDEAPGKPAATEHDMDRL